MAIDCDVLVVGGGPAGLAASITASYHDMDTILVEKSSEIGYPVKTSALTWKEVLDEWKLSNSVMKRWYSSFFIKSANSGREKRVDFADKKIGALDYHKFLQELAFKAVNNGSKMLLSEKVEEPLMEGSFVKGVKTSNRKIESQIVLDCSGPNAVVGREVGLLPDRSKMDIGIGKEYELTNFKVNDPKTLEFYVGKEIVPIGYGWVFPLKKNRARVGVSTVYNTPEKLEKKDINYWHDKFLDKDSPIHKNSANSQPYEVHMGAYPLQGMLEKPYSNGLIMAGDSASQASMLLGEGIRYALVFGKKAANTAVEAIEAGDCSEDQLKKYVKRCKEYTGGSFDTAGELLDVPTNEYWETIIDAVGALSEEDRGDLFLKYLKSEITEEDAKELFPSFEGEYI